MDKYGKFTAPGTLRFERLLQGPIEKVWQYLTDGSLRGKWLAGGGSMTRVEDEVELQFDHHQLSALPDPVPEKYKQYKDGSGMKVRVLKYQPPHRLTISWEENSEVNFELNEKGDQVLLVLTHCRIPESRDFKIGVCGGWHTHLNILQDNLAGQEPKPFWKVHMQLEEEYESRLYG
jgi:uncharacterized protein YndB with AHSA1/START domain